MRTVHYYVELLGSTAAFTHQLLGSGQATGVAPQDVPLWVWALQRWESAQLAAADQAAVRLTRLASIASQVPEASA